MESGAIIRRSLSGRTGAIWPRLSQARSPCRACTMAALHSGFAHTVLADDARNILVYSRDLGDAHVYVLVNRSDKAQSVDLSTEQVDRNARLIDWLDATQAAVRPAPATPEGRPQIEPISGTAPAVVVRNGRASVNLKPWGAMILAPADAK